MQTATEKARIRIVNSRNRRKEMQDKKREEQRRRYAALLRFKAAGLSHSDCAAWKQTIREIAQRGVFDEITERGETLGKLREAERIARIHGGKVFFFHEWRGFCDREYIGKSDYELPGIKTFREFAAFLSDAENGTEGYSLAMRIIARKPNGVAVYSRSLI